MLWYAYIWSGNFYAKIRKPAIMNTRVRTDACTLQADYIVVVILFFVSV